MGNFKSIEEVERMASIVSDMGKSKTIIKDGPYDMCAAMESVYQEAYLKFMSERSGNILNKKLEVLDNVYNVSKTKRKK